MQTAIATPDSPTSRKGWWVLFAAVLGMAFSPGPAIFGSLGLFAPHLNEAFGWGRGEIMLSLTFFNVAGVVVSPAVGWLLDRLGVRRVMLPSILALVAGFLIIAGVVSTLPVFYAVAFVWGALTVGAQSISYAKLVTGWFDKRRGFAIGVVAAGLGLGYSLVPLIVSQLLGQMDWRSAMIALGGVIVAVSFTANLILARPNPLDAANGSAANPAAGLTASQARKTREFWLMAGGILLGSTALTGVVPHMSLFALDRGFDASAAAIVASAYGLSTIVGRVLVGSLADRFFVPRVAIIFFGVSAIGFVIAGVFGLEASMPILLLIAVTIGLGFGAESDIIALFIAYYFGRRAFGAIYGYLLAVFLVGASIGPALFGFGRDAGGSYVIPMFAAAATMVGACLLLGLLPRRAPLTSDATDVVHAGAVG